MFRDDLEISKKSASILLPYLKEREPAKDAVCSAPYSRLLIYLEAVVSGYVLVPLRFLPIEATGLSEYLRIIRPPGSDNSELRFQYFFLFSDIHDLREEEQEYFDWVREKLLDKVFENYVPQYRELNLPDPNRITVVKEK